MKHLSFALVIFLVSFGGLNAQQTTSIKKPPVGVPADAKFFNGKWYHVYIEKTTWPDAKHKCTRLGGRLAVVPDQQTNVFIRDLTKDLVLWLGASEKVNGLWEWVDGTPWKFTGWSKGEPDDPGLDVLITWKGAWGDTPPKAQPGVVVVGYVCEWKAK